MKFIILFSILTIAPVFGFNQEYIDLFRVEYDMAMPQEFVDTNAQGEFSELAADMLVPIILNDRFAIVTGALIEQSRVSLEPFQAPSTLYGCMLKLGINHKHSEKWSGTYLLLPKLSSDLRRIRKKDIQIGGLALIKYAAKPNFNYRFGVYANSDLYAPMVVPFFGIYLLKKKWEITSALPINAQLGYQIHKRLQIGARFDGINKSYLLNNGTNQYMEKVNNEIGLFIRVNYMNFHVQLLGGYALGRSFRTYRYGDRFDFALSAIKFNNNRTILNQDFKDGPIFRFSLTYRLPTPKQND